MMGMLLRRYHRQKVQAAILAGEEAVAGVFQHKLNENPGTPLPYNIQANTRASLIAANMTALEDVQNATDEELTALPHITSKNVQALRDQVQAALTARDIAGGAHALPSDFPADNALTVAGYTTYESLADHTVKHLELIPGVAPTNLPSSAPAILEAYAAWVAAQV
jgi:hypothetical protein